MGKGMSNIITDVITTYLYRESMDDALVYENKDFRLSVQEVWHREFPIHHSAHQWRRHAHDFWEVRLILQGESAVELEDRRILLLKAGDFVIFPPNMQHCVMSESDNLIKFGMECLLTPKETEIGKLYTLLSACLTEPKAYHFSPKAAQLIEQLLALFDDPGIDFKTNILLLSASLLLDLLNSAASQLGWMDPHLEARVKKAVRYINETVSAHTNAGQVAETVGLSVRQLDRLFVAELGETVNAVIERTKRQKIRGLLMDPKVSLKDIVRIMNYNDMTAFVRAFRRAEGITPKQFRKAMKVDHI